MIDILAMLKEKTKGNLSKDEDALLEQVLFNLRMHYVRIVEEQKKSGRKKVSCRTFSPWILFLLRRLLLCRFLRSNLFLHSASPGTA
jgi:hypothetical protein